MAALSAQEKQILASSDLKLQTSNLELVKANLNCVKTVSQ